MHFVLVHGASRCDRLKAELEQAMPGGHSPFLSRRRDRAGVLDHVATTAIETAHG
jgi:hypothetical protein